MPLSEFQVLCRACGRKWLRIGHVTLLCPFCGSADYQAVRTTPSHPGREAA